MAFTTTLDLTLLTIYSDIQVSLFSLEHFVTQEFNPTVLDLASLSTSWNILNKNLNKHIYPKFF